MSTVVSVGLFVNNTLRPEEASLYFSIILINILIYEFLYQL